ncbi:hypothetical protein DVA67_026600 [Solirubrobacter sp. CPCC 204708]|uniref:Nuclear transport factor 2 family protein n=1 Tax=Solirubrobacter deserti TaxID=2282478 RepID=A0ABT4RF43_9ACTN|nr:hypothetical protein [Solirubrobacter deserti]MBE2319566.1 hypothetical protein [Solirubrobacter deserti]MDA0137147.1 nuclear transport factor 2 family protein [Solirubrobacter deserti]
MRGLLVAVLLVAIGVCGCGGGPSDQEQVQTTVEAFGRATAAKDYQRLCDELLSPKLVEEVASSGLPCEAALRQGLGEVRAPTLTIGKITVDDDRATAEVNSAAQGQSPSRDTLQLERVDDAWRIASLR